MLLIKMHYPVLGADMPDAGRVFWLVRHPLSNIVSQAKWHITGSHTKVVTQEMFANYLNLGTFRYHLRMWVDHARKWHGRVGAFAYRTRAASAIRFASAFRSPNSKWPHLWPFAFSTRTHLCTTWSPGTGR